MARSDAFKGLRIVSLEARRAQEIERMIRNYGGEPVVVPAMREAPLSSNAAVFAFAADLLQDRFDLVAFTTGVGVEAILRIAELHHPRQAILDALRRTKVAARGVKPLAVLRQLQVPVHLCAPEPNTWRELLAVMESEFGDHLRTMRVALQEYGVPNPEMHAELAAHCGELIAVPVYRWELPDDLAPLRRCIEEIVSHCFDVALFMTAVQMTHLVRVAEQIGKARELIASLKSMVVLSIGPTTTEELLRHGITPDFEPSHPKMGYLIDESAPRIRSLLEQKARRGDTLKEH